MPKSLFGVQGFRRKLLVAMMVVVSVVTAVALYLSDHNLVANIERELQTEFNAELERLHYGQEVRHAALVERCRALVRKPRIHAALEDDALDLLYPSAEDELRDMMVPPSDELEGHGPVLRARFYRFLDRAGHVIPPPANGAAGELPPGVEARLALPGLTNAQQVGYLPATDVARNDVTEIIATPIISTETGDTIAALVLGFKPLSLAGAWQMQSGIWVNGQLHLRGVTPAASAGLATAVAATMPQTEQGSGRVVLDGAPYRMFFNQLNAGSRYPAAFEVSIFPLDQFAVRRAQLRYRIIAIAALLIAGAFLISHLFARRLSAPVEQLAVDSERSARFSANASHQLKTPVTVLRAGLEELLTRDNLTEDECAAIAALIHQTYRLSSLIEDLLLLSRMDSGRLKLSLGTVDLNHLIAGALDDLSATPDDMELAVDTDLPPQLSIEGEQRYTAIILQNLLENARKYNRRGGRIRLAARVEGESVFLTIANTGRPIAPAAQEHIFERFHRGAMGENVPGYGLGLNLARELARLHEGELRLIRSDAEWTEFEVRFRVARPAPVPA